MKKKVLLIATAGVFCVLTVSCGPIVTGGPDVVVGGGIYPAPIPVPPPGPNIFRPGAPNGPGFQRPGAPGIGNPGGPFGRPGGPGGPGGPFAE